MFFMAAFVRNKLMMMMMMMMINHGGTNSSRLPGSFVYNLRRNTLWNSATTSNTINCVNDNESWYSAVSKIKSLKIVFSPHKRSKFNLTIQNNLCISTLHGEYSFG